METTTQIISFENFRKAVHLRSILLSLVSFHMVSFLTKFMKVASRKKKEVYSGIFFEKLLDQKKGIRHLLKRI